MRKIMKKWYVLTGMLVVFCCLAACGRAAEDKEAGSRTEENRMEEGREAESRAAEEEMTQGEDGGVYTFTDDLGREVSVSSCERTAALLGSYADMWILAGGNVCAAPEDAFDDLDLPLAEDTVNLGATKRLSLELLLSGDPDFVLASTNTPQHLEWQGSHGRSRNHGGLFRCFLL